MKSLRLIATVVFAAATSFASLAAAQCQQDTDCKGTRICEHGNCVEPPPAAPLAQPAPAGSPHEGGGALPLTAPSEGFRHGFFVAGVVLGFHGWGHADPGGSAKSGFDVSENFWPGVYLSGYGALGSHFLLGGYFSYAAGEVEARGHKQDQSEIGFGLSLKLGSNFGGPPWLGAAIDLGPVFHTQSNDDTLKGISLFPRLELNQVLFNLGGFKLGIYTALGPLLIPYTSGTTGGWNANFWMISMEGIVGLALGR